MSASRDRSPSGARDALRRGRRASRRASRPRTSCWSTAAAGAAGHPGAVSRDVSPLRADAGLPRRDRGAVEAEPDQPEGAGTVGRPVADEHRRLLRAPQGRTAVRARSRATTPGSPGCGASSRRQRANLQHVEPFRLPSGKALTQGEPAGARGRRRDVWQYAKAHDIPLLPLYELGYSSIGCEPCTSLPLDPSNPRSGRWQGQKLECGIHIQPVDGK